MVPTKRERRAEDDHQACPALESRAGPAHERDAHGLEERTDESCHETGVGDGWQEARDVANEERAAANTNDDAYGNEDEAQFASRLPWGRRAM